MRTKTPLDKELQALNTIQLTNEQQAFIWKNIKQKVQKQKRRKSFSLKYPIALFVAAVTLVLLTFNFGSQFFSKPNTNAHQPVSHKPPVKKPVTNPPKEQHKPPVEKPVTPPNNQWVQKPNGDSKTWEIISRSMRYDLAAVDESALPQKQIDELNVKREVTFGTVDDPLGEIQQVDSPTRKYALQFSLNQQMLQFKNGQKLILSFGQYQRKNSSDWFWGATVMCYQKEDGKYYDLNGKKANLDISPSVMITNGILNIKH